MTDHAPTPKPDRTLRDFVIVFVIIFVIVEAIGMAWALWPC